MLESLSTSMAAGTHARERLAALRLAQSELAAAGWTGSPGGARQGFAWTVEVEPVGDPASGEPPLVQLSVKVRRGDGLPIVALETVRPALP